MEQNRDQLMEGLRSEGVIDSSGSFTLNPARARAMIRERLLEEPNFYALCLLAGAIANGAENLRLLHDATRFDLIFDGPAISRQELEQLSLGILSHTTPALRELNFGLMAATALAPRRVVVESKDDSAGHRLILDANRAECEAARNLAAGNRINITFAKGIFSNWSRQANLELVPVLRRRLMYHRADLMVNGRSLGQPVDTGRCLAWWRYSSNGREPIQAYPPRAPVHGHGRGDYCGVLALGCSATAVVVVVHGVCYPFRGELEFEGVRGVIYCDDLRKDLSQAQLVEDDAWHRLSHWLRRELRRLARELEQQWDKLDRDQSQNSVPYLDKLAELESRAGNLSDAQVLYERLLRVRAETSEATDPDVLLNLSNLGTLYFLQRRHDEALEIFLAIAEDLQKVGRHQDARTYYERVLRLEAKVSAQFAASILAALVGCIECAALAGERAQASALLAQFCLRFDRVGLPEGRIRGDLLARLDDLERAHPDLAGGDLAEWLEAVHADRRLRHCARCGSRRVLADLPVHKWRVGGHRLRAEVCGACGHVALNAEDFAALWEENLPPLDSNDASDD
ncbi:MAG: tetratricopeptide repeat protein [Vulcanimicrobiota bacterium]